MSTTKQETPTIDVILENLKELKAEQNSLLDFLYENYPRVLREWKRKQ